MTIRGTSAWITPLDCNGNPTGDRMRILDVSNAEWVSDPESEPLDLSGAAVTTNGLRWLDLEVTLCAPYDHVLALLMYGGRIVFNAPKLAINGHEYHRRRRRR
jgi:hypothetical protein